MTRTLIAALLGLVLTAPATAARPQHAHAGVPTTSVAPMLEEVLPAVVNISVTGVVDLESHPMMNDPRMREFLEEEDVPTEQEFEGAGSGVIVDGDNGYILTSAHVLQRAQDVTVTLSSGEKLEASVVGADPETDLAVIQIQPAEDIELHTLPWADVENLRVGDFVVAVGNPFGLEQTVTTGVVSALGRTGLGMQGYEDYIQTDASINPGHSGGALVNMQGELVGINAAILSPGGGNIGIGFAIPVNMAQVVFQQLVEHGEMRRGQIGVMTQDLTPQLAESLKTKARKGAVIADVLGGSPAERAGVRPGDIVLGADGSEISSTGDLRNHIGLLQAGQQVTLDIDRSGSPVEVDVTLTDLNRDEQTAQAEAEAEAAAAQR